MVAIRHTPPDFQNTDCIEIGIGKSNVFFADFRQKIFYKRSFPNEVWRIPVESKRLENRNLLIHGYKFFRHPENFFSDVVRMLLCS
jgi:hypothetical protein